MAKRLLDPTTSALILIDLQNDTLHPKGAYGRAGLSSPAVSAIPGLVEPIAEALRRHDGWVVSTHFTILEGKRGVPFIANNLRDLRPFLRQGDFQAGTWGHKLVDELGPTDLKLDKLTYSAFHMTPLEWFLRQAKVDTLIVAGITTPVSVAATVRDALTRDFKTILLQDGCGAFDAELHRAALTEIATVSPLRTCADVLTLLA